MSIFLTWDAAGYAEFHRGYLAEVSYPGLLVDVRYNTGGHVSQAALGEIVASADWILRATLGDTRSVPGCLCLGDL